MRAEIIAHLPLTHHPPPRQVDESIYCLRGVTPASATSYNDQGMLPDAPSEAQFALARVLAPVPGVPAPLPGSITLAGASQLVR